MSLVDYYEKIFSEVHGNEPIVECLSNLAFWADGRNPHLIWLKLPTMLAAEEQKAAEEWLAQEIDSIKNKNSVSVVYFNLREFRDSLGREFSDVGLGFYSTNENWRNCRSYQESRSDLNSSFLRNIGVVCKGESKPKFLRSSGFIGFSIAYVAFMARELAKCECILERSKIKPITFAVGFTDGDTLEILSVSNGVISCEKKFA